jgi:large subunit ribosomal protein L10
MAVSKAKKGEILSKIKKVVSDAKTIVLVNFHGMTMPDTASVRKDLKSKGANFLVAKKTLTRKVLTEGGFQGEIPELPGELGIVYGEDPIEGARGVYEFQKKLDKRIQIIGGVFEGKFMSQNDMLTIAQIPGLKTLQAQFVNIINSPIQGLVIGLKAIADKKA